ncbi:MAG TPA: glycosyltransferase family 39 protein [Streptosporangiaceae bacterium]|nr:glycosyltransferase family 39 protein [Streptosporangiaceae bacterium]
MTTAAHVQATAQPAGRAPAPRLGITMIAVAAFLLELAVSGRYGYVRDELYFLAAGKHLAFGYVDQPALTPLIARISADLTGNSLVGLRIVPALGLAALVVMTAAMSRLLGAGRTGQLLAAFAAASCAEFVGAMHELTTTVPDFLFWALTLLLVTRLLITQDPRWWIAIGACAGLATEAKWNIVFLVGALGVGFLVTDSRRLLRSRYVAFAGVLAVALAVPDLVWQAAHGWPNFAVFHALQSEAWHNRVTYWPAQFLFTGIALTPIWVSGLVWTLRNPQGRAFRPIAIACGLAIVLQFVLGGKPYYPGGVYTFLFAAGAVPAERWLHAKADRIKGAVIAMVISTAGALVVAIPLLPAAALHTVPLQKINYDLAESIAWPKQVALVAREYHALAPSLRRHTTVITANYGEAGAIDRYGAQYGLRQVYSGANNFWLWGPPPASATAAIAVDVDPALLRREFTSVRLVAVFHNGIGVDDDEQGARIYLATGLRTPWSRAWTAFRDYS